MPGMLPPGPLLALSLTHLGDVARVRKDYDLALNYYHQALAVDEARKDARGRACAGSAWGAPSWT